MSGILENDCSPLNKYQAQIKKTQRLIKNSKSRDIQPIQHDIYYLLCKHRTEKQKITIMILIVFYSVFFIELYNLSSIYLLH